MTEENRINWTELAKPFDPADVEFRAGATNQDKTKALALAYITSRAVMDRLDSVVGPANWRDEYHPGPDGGVLCGISIRVDNQWVTKFDGAENTAFESIKGGLSDSFKRAAVKWGIGRYLYSLPTVWVNCQVRGKTVVIDQDMARHIVFNGVEATNGKTESPGQLFGSIDELLSILCQQTGVSVETCKAALYEAGYNTFSPSKSVEMYQAGLAELMELKYQASQ